MMGWTEADNKNPRAQRFILFPPYFLLIFFSPSLSRLDPKPYSVNSVFPSLCSQHRPSSNHSPTHSFASVSTPRYPSRWPLPIVTHHVRFPGHVKDLQPHVLLVQNTRHTPADPSVQGQLNPIIRPSRELPRAGCYSKSDSGELEPSAVRQNPCCEIPQQRELTLPSLHSFSASITIRSLVSPFTSTDRSSYSSPP